MADAYGYRAERIMNLYRFTSELVGEVEPYKPDRSLEIAQQEMESLTSLVKLIHTGNRGYEVQDLSSTERDQYKLILHNVKILGALYGPREA